MRAKNGEAKNKFIPPYDKEKAEKLFKILEQLKSYSTISLALRDLDDILHRPSYMRKCDVNPDLFEAIKKI